MVKHILRVHDCIMNGVLYVAIMELQVYCQIVVGSAKECGRVVQIIPLSRQDNSARPFVERLSNQNRIEYRFLYACFSNGDHSQDSCRTSTKATPYNAIGINDILMSCRILSLFSTLYVVVEFRC